MAVRRQAGPAHDFGGSWTDIKLKVVGQYLAAYNTALKHQPFKRAYIDAFAGTGYRTAEPSRGEDEGTLLFPDLAEPEPQRLLEGSAAIALRTEPPFDSYIFIEKSPARCAALEILKKEFPNRASAISVRQAEANSEIQKLCSFDWLKHKRRAVLFLDPYGMQVDWETIEVVARTKAIDLWLLFPLGMGMTRVLVKDGKVPEPWQRRVTRLLGTDKWVDELYTTTSQRTLLGEEQRRVPASAEVIAQYFNDRLKTVFPGVAEKPAFLRRGSNPLYLLCFAAANPRGMKPALRIANDLLRGVEEAS